MGRPERRWTLIVLAIVLVAAAYLLVRYREWLLHRPLGWWVAVFTIVGAIATFLGPLPRRNGVRRFLKRPQAPTPEEIATARNNLLAALSGAWSDEVSEVYEDEPMRVRFIPWTPDADQSTAGGFESVADAFAREPRYRRVVLGDAGSGKSVLVAELQRKLIEEPARPDDPLPVIVRAATWEPERQSLLDWLAEQLAADYGWLPVTHARALVARGMVLPILDGLDEMATDEDRRHAIARINKHHIYRPLVLTSREHEYRRAIGDNQADVKHCAVVAVQPLHPDAIDDYLNPTGHGNWAPVLSDLDDDGALARVLANPLTLYLARVEYEGKSPENLMLFGSQLAIEDHLLREFVPTVYGDSSGKREFGQFRCTARQAKRWLGHLAWHTYVAQLRNRRRADDSAGPVLAWWKISPMGWWSLAGALIRAAALVSVAAVVAIRVLERQGNWRHGGYSGHVNLDDLLLDGPVGRLIRPTMHTLARAFRKGIGTSLNGWFHWVDLVLSHSALWIPAAAVLVIIVAIFSNGPSPAPVRLQIRAGAVLRYVLRCPRWFVLAVLASAAFLYAEHWPVRASVFFGSRTTWITFLAISLVPLTGLPRTFCTRSDISGSLTPADSLRLDRQADAVITVTRRAAIIAAAWLFCGPLIAGAYAAYAIAATVITLVLGGQGRFASRCYTFARIWLAIPGQAPWRIMAFLGDASGRGVLRQVGATYQFRHAHLVEQVGYWRSTPGRMSEWAILATGLANRALGEFGVELPRELSSIRKSAADCWNTAQKGPGALPPGFAATLDDLVTRLRGFRDDERAQAAIGDVLAAYRAVAKTDPGAYVRGQVRALREVAGAPYPWDEAFRMTEEAVTALGRLAKTRPDEFLPLRAGAVSDLAVQLDALGRTDQARRLRKRIVATLRARSESNPRRFLPVLGSALTAWANALREAEPAESAAVLTEAVAVYRRLAAAEPARFSAHLSATLDDLAADAWELGRREETIAAFREFLAVCQAQAARVARVRAIMALEWIRGAGSGDSETAAATATAAAVTYRTIAEGLAAQLLPNFAEALHGLVAELRAAGRRREARILARQTRGILGQRAAPKARPLERIAARARYLWILGDYAEALSALVTCRDLAPPERDDRLARATKRAQRALLLGRLAWERLSIWWVDDAAPLQRRGNSLSALAFRQWGAGRRAEARTAASLAVSAQSKAVAKARADQSVEAQRKLLSLRAAAQAMAEIQPTPELERTSTPARSG